MSITSNPTPSSARRRARRMGVAVAVATALGGLGAAGTTQALAADGPQSVKPAVVKQVRKAPRARRAEHRRLVDAARRQGRDLGQARTSQVEHYDNGVDCVHVIEQGYYFCYVYVGTSNGMPVYGWADSHGAGGYAYKSSIDVWTWNLGIFI